MQRAIDRFAQRVDAQLRRRTETDIAAEAAECGRAGGHKRVARSTGRIFLQHQAQASAGERNTRRAIAERTADARGTDQDAFALQFDHALAQGLERGDIGAGQRAGEGDIKLVGLARTRRHSDVARTHVGEAGDDAGDARGNLVLTQTGDVDIVAPLGGAGKAQGHRRRRLAAAHGQRNGLHRRDDDAGDILSGKRSLEIDLEHTGSASDDNITGTDTGQRRQRRLNLGCCGRVIKNDRAVGHTMERQAVAARTAQSQRLALVRGGALLQAGEQDLRRGYRAGDATLHHGKVVAGHRAGEA